MSKPSVATRASPGTGRADFVNAATVLEFFVATERRHDMKCDISIYVGTHDNTWRTMTVTVDVDRTMTGAQIEEAALTQAKGELRSQDRSFAFVGVFNPGGTE